MKRIDFNDKFTKLVDEAYNEIVKILKTFEYDKDKGFNILNEEEGIYAQRSFVDDYDIVRLENIKAIRISPEYDNVIEYQLDDKTDEWYSDWYDQSLVDIFPVYDALCDT